MSRSIKVAPECISRVKQALKRNSYPSQKKFAEDIEPSLSTVKKFLSGKPIDYENFIEICEKLGLDWQEIACKETPPPQNPTVKEPSPFIAGTPITQPRDFFGRQKELKRLFNLLKRHPLQNAVIIGKWRSGKTSLLHYLKNITTTPAEQLRPGQKSDWLPHPENYRWIFVDFRDSRMASRERLLAYILKCLGMEVPSPCDLDRFMDRVSGKVSVPTVILLDEIGKALESCQELNDDFWNCFRSWACHHASGNLAFVLTSPKSPVELAQQTGHSSPFFNIFGYTATLGPLKESEARSLIASSPIPFPEEDVEWILQQSECSPLLLQILCWQCLQCLSDGETEWRSEGLRQIERFARQWQIHGMDDV